MRFNTPLAAFAVLLSLCLAGCSDRDAKLREVDDSGVPLDRGKKECKQQAKDQATGLAKGDIVNGVADDLYADCLQRRGYFKQ